MTYVFFFTDRVINTWNFVHSYVVSAKARYTLATKLNSTRSTLLKVDKVDRVALAPYTLTTKSTVSTTKSTATSCQIHVVADLLPKPKQSRPYVDFVAVLLPVSATVDFQQTRPCWIQLCCQCVPGFRWQSLRGVYSDTTQLNSTRRRVELRRYRRVYVATQLNSTDPVEQRTAKSVVFLFMTSRPTNWVNWVTTFIDRWQLSWVVSL